MVERGLWRWRTDRGAHRTGLGWWRWRALALGAGRARRRLDARALGAVARLLNDHRLGLSSVLLGRELREKRAKKKKVDWYAERLTGQPHKKTAKRGRRIAQWDEAACVGGTGKATGPLGEEGERLESATVFQNAKRSLSLAYRRRSW